MHLRRRLVLGALWLAAAPLAAQQSDTTKKPLKFTGDIGLVNAAGNTSVTTLNVGERIDYTGTRWNVTQSLQMVYGKSAGVENANEWHALVRGGRALTSRLSLYLLTAYDRNPFAGIARRFEEGTGLQDKILQAGRDTLTGEAGISAVQQRSTAGANNDFPSARVAGDYTHSFATKAFFGQTLEILPDLRQSQNLRINSETSLVAPLSTAIALKLSYVIRFDNLPEPGFKKTDRLLTAGVQITY